MPDEALMMSDQHNTVLLPRIESRIQVIRGLKAEVVANCGLHQNLKFSKAQPFAFTEHGAIQAANVLASSQAVEMWMAGLK